MILPSFRRRNALVGVLDKPSEFAERAIHEWSAQVFRAEGGPLLSAQLRNMIRTERTKARARQKYDDVEIRAYTDDAYTGPAHRFHGPDPSAGRLDPASSSAFRLDTPQSTANARTPLNRFAAGLKRLHES